MGQNQKILKNKQEIFLVPNGTWRFGTISHLNGNTKYFLAKIQRGSQTALTIRYLFPLQTSLKAPGS